MKDEIRKSHGHQKTKEVFTFDDGLAEQQGPFLSVAGPILAALMLLESPPNKEGEGGPDPNTVWEMLEDALVTLGNANVCLNVWQQQCFSDFLTDLGKRTLHKGIVTDKHLFPHQFHEKIKFEHDHKASTSKLVRKPKEGLNLGLAPSLFVTRPHINWVSGAEETGRGNGLQAWGLQC